MHFKINNRKYLGAKTKLMDSIFEEVNKFTKPSYKNVTDIFGGTGSAAAYFQKKGFDVKVNDFLESNFVIYDAFFGSEEVSDKKLEDFFTFVEFKLKIKSGWFTKMYGDKYFSRDDAEQIETIRNLIDDFDFNSREKNVILASLIYSADRAANSMGHYDVYIKRRIESKFVFKLIDYKYLKPAEIFNKDANELIEEIDTDILYLDPPYNSRQYSNLYHILELLVHWKKPEKLTGISLKNEENLKKSKYSMSQAPDAMLDLVVRAKAKLIVVSYNNFSTTNSRSESKISLDTLIKILETRGKVTVKEIPYKMYASNKKKSAVEKYSELVLICEVSTNDIFNVWAKYPFNYMGGKFKQLNEIISSLPEKIDNFYDLFAGGGNVGVNVKAKNIFLNEKNFWQYRILKEIYEQPTFKLLEKVEQVIKHFGLTYSGRNGKHPSGDNLKETNREAYSKLRRAFNIDKDIYKFITLVIYSFNNSINFNEKGEYNIPGGKRDFNKNMLRNYLIFSQKIKSQNIVISNCDFEEVDIQKKSVIYMDPPYLVTFAHYNKGWSDKDESRLLKLALSKGNVLLSNVLNKGQVENEILKQFISDNNKIINDFATIKNHSNSWFHRKPADSKEILIGIKMQN